MHISVPAVKVEKLTSKFQAESSSIIQKRVQKARDIQLKRFKGLKITSNAEMNNKDIKKYCELSNESLGILKMAVNKLNLSSFGKSRAIYNLRFIEPKTVLPNQQTFRRQRFGH